ncbi:MAG TPA: flagellar basal body rod protein FlgC [Verrucomicrobiae bacterium]
MIQILSGIQGTASALDAEHTRLDVIAQNIANSHTTHDVDGKPYQRRVVLFENELNQAMNGDSSSLPTMHVAKIEKDTRGPLKVYDPGNPEADNKGYINLPNINVHEEMADLISASRTFEANLAVVKNARSMAMQTLAIGRH